MRESTSKYTSDCSPAKGARERGFLGRIRSERWTPTRRPAVRGRPRGPSWPTAASGTCPEKFPRRKEEIERNRFFRRNFRTVRSIRTEFGMRHSEVNAHDPPTVSPPVSVRWRGYRAAVSVSPPSLVPHRRFCKIERPIRFVVRFGMKRCSCKISIWRFVLELLGFAVVQTFKNLSLCPVTFEPFDGYC